MSRPTRSLTQTLCCPSCPSLERRAPLLRSLQAEREREGFKCTPSPRLLSSRLDLGSRSRAYLHSDVTLNSPLHLPGLSLSLCKATGWKRDTFVGSLPALESCDSPPSPCKWQVVGWGLGAGSKAWMKTGRGYEVWGKGREGGGRTGSIQGTLPA